MNSILSYAVDFIVSFFVGRSIGADIRSLDNRSPAPIPDSPSSPDDSTHSRDPLRIIESSPLRSYKHDYGNDIRLLNNRSPSSTSNYLTTSSSPVDNHPDILLDTTHGLDVLSPSHGRLGFLSPSPHHSPLPRQSLLPVTPPTPLFPLPQGSPALEPQDRSDPTRQDARLPSKFAFLSSPSSSALPFPSLQSLDFPQSDSESYSRSSMLSTHISNSHASTQPPAKSAVSDVVSPPTLLTTEILSIGDGALSTYEAVRKQRPSEEQPQLAQPQPFSSFSVQGLEKYFAAAADAKNALQLRKSVVAVDIGDALEALLPKLTIYEQDELIIGTALEEMELIREECSHRGLQPNFYALEFLRYILPLHNSPSIMEEHRQLFSSIEHILGAKYEAQQAAEQFLRDPYALKERRLPHLWTSQR